MGSLDASKDEILEQLLEGEWNGLFPSKIYNNLLNWINNQKNKYVTIRFTFYQSVKNNNRYAMYLLCESKLIDGKIAIKDLKFSVSEHALSIPPSLYDIPLYCMPEDLLQKILRKRKKPRE